MSQKAVFVRLNGNLHNEVFPSVPDHDEMIQICKDFGYESTDGEYDEDYINVEYEWVDIGDGESGTDTFFDDESLCALYDSYEWEENFKNMGYNTESIETGSDEVLYSELEDL